MPNHGVVLAGPILAVLFDPTCPCSSSPLVCLTLHRDSGLKLFRALNQTSTQPSYQEGLLLVPHEICIIRSFRPTHTFRHSPTTQHCSLSKAGETVVTPIWSFAVLIDIETVLTQTQSAFKTLRKWKTTLEAKSRSVTTSS